MVERQSVDWGIRNDYGRLRDVLLCRPDHFEWLATSSVSRATLRRGIEFDRELMLKQFQGMVDIYREADVRCHFIESNPHLPYQVFARDSSFMTPYGAVITQPAQWWRRGEYAAAIQFYQDHEIPIFNMITAGSFEGGDFDIIEEGAVLIGYSGERTQERSAQQVRGWLEEKGWEVRLAPIAEHFVHIDLMVCMLADKLAAVCLETTDDEIVAWLKSRMIEMVPVSYRDTMALGCNVVALGRDRVLSTAVSGDLNSRLRALGMEVYDPDMSCFQLGGGGVHCMCQSLKRD